MAKKSNWKKKGTNIWERDKDFLALSPTGKRGVVGKNYQVLHGWGIDYFPASGDSQRIIFPTKKEALAEIKRFTKKRR